MNGKSIWAVVAGVLFIVVVTTLVDALLHLLGVFPPMDQPTYLAAVAGYAKRYGLKVPDLDRRALQWAQLRGARSGRVAWQFIRDLAGELGKPLPL